MAAVARYLADTSALARLYHPEVAAVLAPLIESGVVATCGVIEFELGWATRSSAEFDQVRADRSAGYEWLATRDEDWRRALDVQAALWRGGRMRSVGLPDLLIAAVAERERVTVLHYDGDYGLIAQVTGQTVQWVVPRGTVPLSPQMASSAAGRRLGHLVKRDRFHVPLIEQPFGRNDDLLGRGRPSARVPRHPGRPRFQYPAESDFCPPY